MATTQVWTYRGVETGIDLTGFDVEATDGSIGSVDAATGEAGENYVVVDTGPWIFGKRVLLPAGLVSRIDPGQEKIFVERSREEIKKAPEYDLELGATEAYRRRVGSYYTALEPGPPLAQRPAPRQRASSRQGASSRQSAGSRQRASSRRVRGRRTTTQRTASSSTRARGRSRRVTRGRASDEPTRDELYERAKRLGIDGRSKMNKAQLKRAVARRRRQPGSTQARRSTSAQRRRSTPTRRGTRPASGRPKATPVEVQAFLQGVSYPTRKGDLVREAERKGASRSVRSTLERLRNSRFEDPTEVSEAIGRLR